MEQVNYQQLKAQITTILNINPDIKVYGLDEEVEKHDSRSIDENLLSDECLRAYYWAINYLSQCRYTKGISFTSPINVLQLSQDISNWSSTEIPEGLVIVALKRLNKEFYKYQGDVVTNVATKQKLYNFKKSNSEFYWKSNIVKYSSLKDEMELILKENQTLCTNGMSASLEYRDRESLSEPIGLKQYYWSKAWLSNCIFIKSFTMGSYGLKHYAENWARNYICNGALIAAAIHKGIDYKPLGGPNVLLPISKKTFGKKVDACGTVTDYDTFYNGVVPESIQFV
ncbi:MAG: hypothetical protein F6K22_26040 [Okeania sp. SIO2F4]|uniref:hypothetical protein n=1 Tax=Okeania sp. SIO2F4 TaxID=2607790 RepID=UPI00142C50E8|nr:hypothetical protein [Okeania sp. SIO2F4]NES05960.1 hypothetical protein [Okeania sp. SIO2F4]